MDGIDEFIREDTETELVFFVNGKKVIEPKPDPEWSLLWYLRRKLRLTGTKYGCGEGGCGACTVMISQYLPDKDEIKHIAVNACLTPLCSVHGMAITTVEGIGTSQDKLHPVQERIAKAHGSQCGFCTPGFVMSMYTLLRNKINIEYSDIEVALQGNLCRCTGYRPIIEGFKTFVDGWKKTNAISVENSCPMGEKCCKNKIKDNQIFDQSEFMPYDPTQEPIFPPELKINIQKFTNSHLLFKGKNVSWIRPTCLDDLLSIKKKYSGSKIVVGNTEVGVEMNIKKITYPVLISPSLVTEMNTCTYSAESLIVGASLSLSDLKIFLQNYVKNNPTKGKIYSAMCSMLHWFAGLQVRNVACIAGNIITASPISDLNPILMACSATLNIMSSTRGRIKVVIDEHFFTGYRKTILNSDEIVLSIEIPFTSEIESFQAYKQARRKEDDISIVTAAFYVKFEENNNTVEKAKLCYGGMASTTVCALKTSKLIEGMQWNDKMLNAVLESLNHEFCLDVSVPGGMAEYRKSLCLSMFFKFFLYVSYEKQVNSSFKNRDFEDTSQLEPRASQYFEINAHHRKPTDAVGLPISHASALKQAAGEAIYCDDLPHLEGELYLSILFSAKSHAQIISIDASKALAVPGVVAFFSAKDLAPNNNKLGPILKDEEVFYKDIVNSRSCVIGAVVAEDENIAKKARNLVQVTYQDLKPNIITIEDAIKHESFLSDRPRSIVKGDVKRAFDVSDFVIEGESRTGAQEHFYLETMAAFAVRKEEELEIISSTQHPGGIAELASHVLGIPHHKIISKIKRIGGGFGGKETRMQILAIPVALAAYKLKRPVRSVFDRDEDMQVTGYRHPVLVKYKVGFNSDGKINGALFNLYSNAGNSMDISCAMNERALTHLDNCYFIPNMEVNGYMCKTNLPSNTAFRGFGAPQAMLASETMIRHVANKLCKTYEEIVEANFYKEGDLTHYNQVLTYCTLQRCWNECLEMSNYQERKKQVNEFNTENRWKKKGITLVPTKYGISFGIDILMQAGALLMIYSDGSVLLSIGGIEMGQGLFTKMIQVASRVLEIDISKIHISEMSTDKVPNSQPTAGSISSDLYGMAVIDACTILMNRLKPYKDQNPKGKWEDWVVAAYVDRVSLSATGFYAAPKIKYDPVTNKGQLFEYYTYGVACSEVIIDCLTGDHQVIRTDIVMDLGESLNPAIDIGQIEGAFAQGYGLFTIEELVFSSNGELLSRGPGAYKIPAITDIPKEFNVSLLKGAPNLRAVYSSKAVGEPPLFLAASTYFAIYEAIKAARISAGKPTNFTLQAPATCEKIRMACSDDITEMVVPTITRNGKPWSVTL